MEHFVMVKSSVTVKNVYASNKSFKLYETKIDENEIISKFIIIVGDFKPLHFQSSE